MAAVRYAALLGAGLLLAACGGAAPGSPALSAPGGASPSPAPTPGADTVVKPVLAPTEPDPTTVDEAQARIARDRAVLLPDPSSAQPMTGGTSQCASACSAIASMRRAVKSLCGLSGDEDARCVDAKKSLDRCESAVNQCGC